MYLNEQLRTWLISVFDRWFDTETDINTKTSIAYVIPLIRNIPSILDTIKYEKEWDWILEALTWVEREGNDEDQSYIHLFQRTTDVL